MLPFFSYYGSKYRLSKSGFYPKPNGVVCEPFAGSATYSVYHDVEFALLIDKDPDICSLWRYLINATEHDIKSIPSDLNDEIFKKLGCEQKNLVARWVSKGRARPNANTLGDWYHKYKSKHGCMVWGDGVKQRIIDQLPLIRKWKIIQGDYTDVPITTDIGTFFIDPPYSGDCGNKYKYNNKKINWSNYVEWANNLPDSSRVIICENKDACIDLSDIKGKQKQVRTYTANVHKYNTEICITRNEKDIKKKNGAFTYFSLFSGIGGFEVGIQKAIPYAECVGFSEIDPYAKSIYQKHFKTHKDYGDVKKINENELPEFDCLVGGFPCQPFSLSGKRKGFDDTRGTLFFDIVRILKAKRPKMFVLENVRGLLSHDEGRTFGTIITTLDELRYDVQWQVLNCKHHGTPQDRNRVFIVGYSRTCGQGVRKILPIRYSGSKTTKLSWRQAVANTLRKQYADGSRGGSYIIEGGKPQVLGNINPSGLGMNGKVYSPFALAPTLTRNKGEGIKIFHSERAYISKNSGKAGGDLGILSRDDEISYALTKAHSNHVIQLTQSGLTQGARVYNPFGIGVTLNSKGGGMGANTGLYYVKDRVRRLMPIECERLQDFPDNWTKFGKNNEVISDAQRYGCIGNAVNTRVVEDIFKKLRTTLIDKKTEEKILIPKVVSFSGGRTSGMLLLQLLERGELKQWRGDCVVFNNTSVEHSATYAFVSRIKKITEEQYNIPFFMTEFCTYEAKTNRGYVRRKTYKLVNDLPYCERNNINGYKFKGEVFEESISQTGVLPSTYQRNCTINMKILTTNNFLKDWMASKPYIDQQGEPSKTSNISDTDIVKKHRRYNGELSDEAIIDKKTFVRSCQTFRPKQFFKDYTSADIDYNNAYLQEKVAAHGCIPLLGKNAIKYHNYLGIRFDEQHRAVKIRQRIKDAKTNLSRKGKNKISSAKTQPPFENANMPMIKARIDKQKVIEFWTDPVRTKYDLDLPYDGMLSNCVHCMLKGKSKNQLIAKQAITLDNLDNTDVGVTPNSINWWAWIEQKYSRKVIKSNKNKYTNIGFFGASENYVYQTWVDELSNSSEEDLVNSSESDSWVMDCNCTD